MGSTIIEQGGNRLCRVKESSASWTLRVRALILNSVCEVESMLKTEETPVSFANVFHGAVETRSGETLPQNVFFYHR